MKTCLELAEGLGIPKDDIIPYGWDKAKIRKEYYEKVKDNKTGKLVLVTAVTPTKAGEGKTTTTIGLHDGLRRIGVNSLACLREPSLGPVWGIKGGAVGALKSTIVPSDDINLHFTGDMHALTATINLMSAIIENHIWQGNELRIDPNSITWTRAVDINDRSLRNIKCNAEGTGENVLVLDDEKQMDRKMQHDSGYTITVASELMTILCLSKSEQEFMDRVNDIIIGYTYPATIEDHLSELKAKIGHERVDTSSRRPVRFGEFHCSKAILKMMKDALNPNLVQTLEENPVLVHGGPFANISIGVNSLIATRMALKMSDVVVTEAGFGADLGAEKFLDIACREGGFAPDCVVLVATIRALKLHGGVLFEDLDKENCEAIEKGFCNLKQHFDNLEEYGVPVVVAINRFPSDTDSEIEVIENLMTKEKMEYALNEGALKGSEGAIELARTVEHVLANAESHYKPMYENAVGWSIKDKIGTICHKIYHADSVEYSEEAEEKIRKYAEMGYSTAYVCISKTPNSFTDDPKILGAPEGHTVHIRDVKLYAGANLIVPLTGSVMTMPGLPKEPRCLDKFN